MNFLLNEPAARLVTVLKARGWTVSCAESCTGGMVAAAITSVPGCSDIFREAYVAYSDEAKMRVLGVAAATLSTAGSVSESCAGEMARNLEKLTHCDLALSVTGYAGPAGGTEATPVGTVWFGIAVRGTVETFVRRFAGDREAVRFQAAATILEAAFAKVAER